MAAFDPDAYLSAAPKSASVAPPAAFDPDAYLSAVPQPQYGSAVPQLDVTGAPIRQEAIPGERQPSRGVLDFAVGLPEAALTLGSGAVAGAVAPYVAAGEEILGGRYGTGSPETERRAAELTQKYTYQPTSQTGQELVGAAGEAMQSLRLPPVPGPQGLAAASMAPAALRQGANIIGNEAGLVSEAVRSIPAVRQAREARIAQSYANAPKIEAAQLAEKHNISLDPAESNPIARNRLRSAVVGGDELKIKLAKDNEPKWTIAAKKALGLDENARLNSPKVYDNIRAREDISGPYNAVREIPSIKVTKDALKSLDDLRIEPLLSDAGEAKRVGIFIDDLKAKLKEEFNGDKLLDSIRDLRNQAQKTYAQDKANAPISNKKRMVADAKMDSAKILESLIDDNIRGIGARDAFRNARIKMAETYDLQSATDFGTERINPKKLAKKVSEARVPYTGIVDELGRIASIYPETANITPKNTGGFPRLTRAGIGGAAGGIIGGLVGGPVGIPVGIALGSGGSDVARRVLANRMLRPGYQASRAIPKDFRPQAPANALRPAEPGQSNIVPFDPRNALVEPEAPGPNFVFSNRVDPDVQANIPRNQPPQIGMGRPEDIRATTMAEDARRTRMARMAEAEGLAAEARAPRAPTGEGTLLDLDPITGQLRPASRGLPGASLDVVEYGTDIKTVADKIRGGVSFYTPQNTKRINTGKFYKTTTADHKKGEPIYKYVTKPGEREGTASTRAFDLTADEKVLWDKTRVDLAQVDDKFNALTDKAIAERMMDRKWVNDAIKKAQEKDLAFENIARQSKDAQLVQQAQMAREKLQDTLDMLEESLANIRPDNSRKGQGPKTREAQRNNLRSGYVNNNLIEVLRGRE
jgi:hypothetical protein